MSRKIAAEWYTAIRHIATGASVRCSLYHDKRGKTRWLNVLGSDFEKIEKTKFDG